MNAAHDAGQGPIRYVGLPPGPRAALTGTKHYFQALDSFCRVFAVRLVV